MTHEPIKVNSIYKSQNCTDKMLDTKHDIFTFGILLSETKLSIGLFIVGIILTLYGTSLMNQISDTVSTSDTIPTKYAVLTGAGGVLIAVAAWLARHDVAGYIRHDIIQRCKA